MIAGRAMIGYIAGEVTVADAALLRVVCPIAGASFVRALEFWVMWHAEAKARPLVDLAVEEK